MEPITLYIPEDHKLNNAQLLAICERNDHLRIETDKAQNLMIMSPTGYETGNLNSELLIELGTWNRNAQAGRVLDSSTGFKLPDGTIKSPDVSWVEKSRDESLSPDQRKRFAPICPDFVIELRSQSDTLSVLQEKMQQWLNNGCRLAWLIDPENRHACIYRPQSQPEQIEITPETTLSGGDILQGFTLQIGKLL